MFSYFEPNFIEKLYWESGFSNFGHVLSKCKTSAKSGNLLEKVWGELNAGQSVLEWKNECES